MTVNRGEPRPQRGTASPLALRAMYADDLNLSGALGLQTTPIIDQRGDQDPYPGRQHPHLAVVARRARAPAGGRRSRQPGDPRTYTLKCAPKPIDWRDYPVTFTDDEKATLVSAFPDGVCGYRRPGPQEQPPIGTWLNYSFGTRPFVDG